MPRLNNKDFSEEALERLIFLMNEMLYGGKSGLDEIKKLLEGTTLTGGERNCKPLPIEWNFKFTSVYMPKTAEESARIKMAMRSAEVNECIRRRFSDICRDEMNWYYSGVKGFVMEEDPTIREREGGSE